MLDERAEDLNGVLDDGSCLDSDDDPAEILPCPHCGQAVYEESEQCPHCGDWIVFNRRTVPPLWVLLVLLVVLSFLVGVLL